jgi:hypothetical protein
MTSFNYETVYDLQAKSIFFSSHCTASDIEAR